MTASSFAEEPWLKGRWIHPCEKVGAIFGVLEHHACPLCGKDVHSYDVEDAQRAVELRMTAR